MKIAFNIDQNIPEYYKMWLDLIPSYAFVIDIILNFNTAYYSKGIIIEKRLNIIRHYVKGVFFFDLFVIIPLFLRSFEQT
jgi:hypothetical protein